jgi:hypothetical protein
VTKTVLEVVTPVPGEVKDQLRSPVCTPGWVTPLTLIVALEAWVGPARSNCQVSVPFSQGSHSEPAPPQFWVNDGSAALAGVSAPMPTTVNIEATTAERRTMKRRIGNPQGTEKKS